ncbi:MAG: enoyl-CoA hydratase/isomerase family protein [SAR202 cluster bacterium]|nr:enoyl-CoA hydratase/isomerase family protein [SAR202 cluster bacterium]
MSPPLLERRMTYRTIIVDKAEGVATLTLNRPEVLNAINDEMQRELDAALTDLEADDAVRAIIFTGGGDRAFCAGADIHEMARKAKEGGPQVEESKRIQYSWHIAACSKPTIGALNGLAYGGGAVMAASFDIRVGCETTSIRFLAASYGRVNSTWILPMQVGLPMAKELLFTARIVEAKEAFRIGLLNHLVSGSELLNKAQELAGRIAANDPRMVQGIKSLLMSHVGSRWEQMYRDEAEARAGRLAPTPVLEGFKDFLERKGRK